MFTDFQVKPVRDLNLTELTAHVKQINTFNGWFDKDRTIAEDIVLIVTEVGELGECLRDSAHPAPEEWFQENGKPEGVGSELADILIRVLDMAERHGIDIADAVAKKSAHNARRGHRHGGKAL